MLQEWLNDAISATPASVSAEEAVSKVLISIFGLDTWLGRAHVRTPVSKQVEPAGLVKAGRLIVQP